MDKIKIMYNNELTEVYLVKDTDPILEEIKHLLFKIDFPVLPTTGIPIEWVIEAHMLRNKLDK